MTRYHPEIADAVEHSVSLHGKGIVLTVLEGLQRAHVVRTEVTKHGLFTKFMYGGVARFGKDRYCKTLALNELIQPKEDYRKPQCFLPPPPDVDPPCVPRANSTGERPVDSWDDFSLDDPMSFMDPWWGKSLGSSRALIVDCDWQNDSDPWNSWKSSSDSHMNQFHFDGRPRLRVETSHDGSRPTDSAHSPNSTWCTISKLHDEHLMSSTSFGHWRSLPRPSWETIHQRFARKSLPRKGDILTFSGALTSTDVYGDATCATRVNGLGCRDSNRMQTLRKVEVVEFDPVHESVCVRGCGHLYHVQGWIPMYINDVVTFNMHCTNKKNRGTVICIYIHTGIPIYNIYMGIPVSVHTYIRLSLCIEVALYTCIY